MLSMVAMLSMMLLLQVSLGLFDHSAAFLERHFLILDFVIEPLHCTVSVADTFKRIQHDCGLRKGQFTLANSLTKSSFHGFKVLAVHDS